MPDILVTGANGQLGTALARTEWPAGWNVVALDRAMLDLADTAAIAARVAEHPWAAVINAAAYTAVDKAESDALAAWQVNALAPAALAAGCRRAGIPIVQVSTDYVFAGGKPVPGDAGEARAWETGDPVGPLGVYGASKLGGELAVRTSGARYAIVRTAWLVSARGSNFVRTMLRLGATCDEIAVVDDQTGSPTGAADLAAALATIAVRIAEDPQAPIGTFHFANAGAVTWAGFAAEIFCQSALRGGPAPRVVPITTADCPMPARRPANSRLSTAALTAAYGITPRPWQAMLEEILDDLIGAPQ